MESEINYADEILELVYKIMTKNDADPWPITGHITQSPTNKTLTPTPKLKLTPNLYLMKK